MDELSNLDPQGSDELNEALESAMNSFNQNPTFSAANDVFYSAMESFPPSVTLSLYCSGYGGININSLPPWLSAVPTSYVSDILQEQLALSSILSSFVASATTATPTGIPTTASGATTSMPSTTVPALSSSAPGSTSSITSSTSTQKSSPSPSSGKVSRPPIASLANTLILTASLVLVFLL